LRHPHQAAASESVERPLAEPAEARDGSPAAGNDDLSSTLYSLQVLAEAIVQLSDTDFALILM
jgi:hypothetical protein